MLSFRCFQNIHSAAFTDKNLPLFSLDGYLADHLPRIQKEDQWDTVSYFFKEMLKQRDELKRLEDMEREVMTAVQRCLGHWTVCFFMLSFLWGHFIVSQGCCESRQINSNPRANSVLSVFYFNQKRVHVFYKWLSVLLPRGWGVAIYNGKK